MRNQICITISDDSKKVRPFRLFKWTIDTDKKQISADILNGQNIKGFGGAYEHIMFDIGKNGFECGCINIQTEDEYFLRRGTLQVKGYYASELYSQKKILIGDLLQATQYQSGVRRITFEHPLIINGNTELEFTGISDKPVTIFFGPEKSYQNTLYNNALPVSTDDISNFINAHRSWYVLKSTSKRPEKFWVQLSNEKYSSYTNQEGTNFYHILEVINKNIEIVDSSEFDKIHDRHKMYLPILQSHTLKKVYANPSNQLSTNVEIKEYHGMPLFAISPMQFQDSMVEPNFKMDFLFTSENRGQEVIEMTMLPEAEMVFIFDSIQQPTTFEHDDDKQLPEPKKQKRAVLKKGSNRKRKTSTQ